jgi:hypothetical protein
LPGGNDAGQSPIKKRNLTLVIRYAKPALRQHWLKFLFARANMVLLPSRRHGQYG